MLVIAGNWVLWISQEASTHWLIWIEDSVFRNSSLKAVVHIPWLYVMTFQDDLDMGNLFFFWTWVILRRTIYKSLISTYLLP